MTKTNTKRRRSLQIAALLNLNEALLLGCFTLAKTIQKPKLGRKTPSLLPRLRETNPRNDEQLGFGYTARCFERLFRMTRAIFVSLLEIVQLDLTKDFESARRLGNVVTAPDVRLGITLRVLSGGKYQAIAHSHRIGFSSVYHIFHETSGVIGKRLKIDGLPESEEEIRRLAEGFKTFRCIPSPLTSCIGALDGILIPIKKPEKCHNPAPFYWRKGYYALPVQALVSFDYKFLSVSIKCVGSTHDSLCHNVSELGRFLKEKGLSTGHWIVGDEAFTCSEVLITTVPSSKAGEDEVHFNYFLSSLRIIVEQAFGVLVSKWRILKSDLLFGLEKSTRIFVLCMKLHNFLISKNTAYRTFEYSDADLRLVKQQSDEWYAFCAGNNGNNHRAHAVPLESRKRTEMIRIVKQLGLKRHPVYRATETQTCEYLLCNSN